MEQSERQWLKERCGYLSASELDNLRTPKTKTELKATSTLISQKRFERTRGYPWLIKARNLDIGNEQETYIAGWIRENYPEAEIIHSKELDIPLFRKVTWAKFGASPDAWSPDFKRLYEFKTLCGAADIAFFHDPTIPYEEKRAYVIEKHGDQLKGQFLAVEECEEIWLVKYIYQDDFNDLDTEPTTAPYRGMVFRFRREDFDLESMKYRIIFNDMYIDSPNPPSKLGDKCLVKYKNGRYALRNVPKVESKTKKKKK